jgi:branched-chain amino acid transport system permease protein
MDPRNFVPVARAALIVLLLVCVAGPWLISANAMAVLTDLFILLTIALMWNLLAGYADIISVGQHGFVGVGAYAFFGLTALAHFNPFFAAPLAAAIATLIAIPAMAIIFRLRAAYLAVGAWVEAETLSLIAGKLPGFGGGSGASLPIPIVKAFGATVVGRVDAFYWLSLALAALAFAATWALLRSRIGLGLIAMRDNEEAAGSAGVNLTMSRIICFLWTAPFLGLAGVLITLEKLRVAPTASFSIADWTIFPIFAVVIGGIGSLEGPLIGAVVFVILRENLSGFGAWYPIALGVASIVVMVKEPRGLWGLARRLGIGELIPVATKRRKASPPKRDWAPSRKDVGASDGASLTASEGAPR